MPLFLLQTVLFPHAHLQLHVFEDRYLQMVRECMENEESFGIVLIRSGEEIGGPADPYLIGTQARITRVIELEGGRLDLQVKGVDRFRIRKLEQGMPYPVGFVEPVDEGEVPDEPRTDALAFKCREECQAWIEQVVATHGYHVHVQFPDDATDLSFAVSNLLPIDTLEKQRLLELTDTPERLLGLITLLQEQVSMIEFTPTPMRRVVPEDFEDWHSNN